MAPLGAACTMLLARKPEPEEEAPEMGAGAGAGGARVASSCVCAAKCVRVACCRRAGVYMYVAVGGCELGARGAIAGSAEELGDACCCGGGASYQRANLLAHDRCML